MVHLGASQLPVLLAIVSGAIAFAFALADVAVFSRSSYGYELGIIALVMATFTGYHVILAVDHGLGPTSDLFGGVIETIIGLAAVAVLALDRYGSTGERRS